MKISGKFAAMSALIGIAFAQPAQACWSDTEAKAASVANLNMMMMVSALRCRKGPNNFLDDYNRFVKANTSVVGSQNAIVKARFARLLGAKSADGALDRLTVGYANHYGGGHATMDCAALGELAARLGSRNFNADDLYRIADQSIESKELPGGLCGTRVASK